MLENLNKSKLINDKNNSNTENVKNNHYSMLNANISANKQINDWQKQALMLRIIINQC